MTNVVLLSDIDGTLVDFAGNLLSGAFYVEQVANELGIIFGLCSARPAWSAQRLAEELGSAVSYTASFQGAMISERQKVSDKMQSSKWEILRRQGLSPDLLPMISSMIRPDDSLWVYTEEDWFVREPDDAARRESHVMKACWTGVGFEECAQPLKFVVVREREPGGLLNALRTTALPVTYSMSQPGYIEIISDAIGNDKGARMLRALAKSDDTSPFMIAIGDGENDLGMLEAADLSITFADAPSGVRAVANVVLPSDRNLALNRLSDLLIHRGYY